MASFVGREQELALLHERWQRALGGHGNILFLSADPGAGKSTLINRFLDEAAASHDDALIIRAGCSEQFGAGEPYQPFVETFRFLTQDRPGRKRTFKELAKQIAPFWVAAIPVAGNVIAASLATASELKGAFSPGAGGGGSAPSEEALFFQYTELLFGAAAEAPVVLFLDDLHWADRATVALLTHMGRKVGECRVLIVGSYRPTEVDAGKHPMREARQELQRYRVAEELVLQPLGTAALADLIVDRAGAVPSPQLFDWLEKRAGSNALFFEELLQWLIAHGFTHENHGQLELVRTPQEIEIPRSAESTIEKRLDRLDEDTRRVLEYASVGGAEFDSVSLAQLLETDELELEERLEPIARLHRLIVLRETRDLPNGDIASVYTFAHALIHDVLHKGLQGKRRILLHRKMAQILEDLYERDAHSVAGRLALHAEEGRLGEKAYEYALIAAHRAARLYAHWDALDQIERAVRNAPDPPRQSQAYQHLGEQLLRIARYPEAINAFREALQRTDASEAPARVVELRHRALVAERDQGQRPVGDVLDEFQRLREEARRIGAAREECHILWSLIDLPGTSESMDVRLAEEALALAQQEQDAELLARSRHMLGLSLTFNGQATRAVEELEQAAAGYAALGDRAREASCHNNIAVARVFLGQFAAAGEAFTATMRIFDELVDPARSGAARSNLGYLLRVLGEYERAETLLHEAVRIAERLEAPVRLLPPVQNLAELYEARGDLQRAEQAWRQLLDLAVRTGYVGEQVIAHCGIGTARLRLQDLDGARAAERDARALVTGDSVSLSESGEALLLFSARLAGAAGELEGALGMLDRLQLEVDSRDPYMGGVCRLEKAKWLSRAHPQRAADLAESARVRFAELGARPQQLAAEELLAELRAVLPLSA